MPKSSQHVRRSLSGGLQLAAGVCYCSFFLRPIIFRTVEAGAQNPTRKRAQNHTPRRTQNRKCIIARELPAGSPAGGLPAGSPAGGLPVESPVGTSRGTSRGNFPEVPRGIPAGSPAGTSCGNLPGKSRGRTSCGKSRGNLPRDFPR